MPCTATRGIGIPTTQPWQGLYKQRYHKGLCNPYGVIGYVHPVTTGRAAGASQPVALKWNRARGVVYCDTAQNPLLCRRPPVLCCVDFPFPYPHNSPIGFCVAAVRKVRGAMDLSRRSREVVCTKSERVNSACGNSASSV